ncbi:megakaryocyte-associated tyrosine-protein kinase isoform X2 [Erinaceus europaeus]|uniref:Tyrosine-protein kinase n=1 Tax=Erinaceus europaeus TaxID=9365 RepID=A0ABM3WN14_ERIEU|nr:megakaryocyte-associated tyrosine-protein kinase isoform X2 [Erinaceus europaeus]
MGRSQGGGRGGSVFWGAPASPPAPRRVWARPWGGLRAPGLRGPGVGGRQVRAPLCVGGACRCAYPGCGPPSLVEGGTETPPLRGPRGRKPGAGAPPHLGQAAGRGRLRGPQPHPSRPHPDAPMTLNHILCFRALPAPTPPPRPPPGKRHPGPPPHPTACLSFPGVPASAWLLTPKEKGPPKTPQCSLTPSGEPSPPWWAGRMPTRRWAPGTQCVTKCEHTRPKPGQLAFHKGDVVTILEACESKSWYRAKHHASGQEGLLAAGALREREALSADPRLSLMPWFHGKISGPEAVQQLQPPEDGLFLVRESARHPGDYVLCVSFGRDVVHYRVHHRAGCLTIDEDACFCNLMDMVEHYTRDQGAICTKLVKPRRKQGTRSAEEELAKAGWLLNLQHLTLGALIGEGEFGAVLQGEYLGQKVAVKNIKCDVTAQAFLDETAVMTKMQHKNLVRLLGVILHQGLYIVMEHGNLVNFLRTRGRALVSTAQLVQFSLHVAEGMEYLEAKKLVHRDLAARNILVSEDLVAKVSDFGLAKAERQGLDASRLPVKWTAPEALKHGVSLPTRAPRHRSRDPAQPGTLPPAFSALCLRERPTSETDLGPTLGLLGFPSMCQVGGVGWAGRRPKSQVQVGRTSWRRRVSQSRSPAQPTSGSHRNSPASQMFGVLGCCYGRSSLMAALHTPRCR